MDNSFNLYFLIFYVLLIVVAGVYLSWMAILRKKNMSMMSNNIKNKLKANVHLTAKNIIHIGRGYNLSPQKSRDVIYNLYVTVDDKTSHTALDFLVSDIEKEEEFDDLPDEVKPAMSRIAKLLDNSTEISDKQVLAPITTKLNEYVELKAEQEKTKKQTNRAYLITIISFVVGSMSFYFTLKSPSDGEIKNVIEQVFIERLANGQTAPSFPKQHTEKQFGSAAVGESQTAIKPH